MPFDPNKLAAAKAAMGPSFDPNKFQKVKDSLNGGPAPTTQPKTMLDYAMQIPKDFASGLKEGLAGRDTPQLSLSGKLGKATGDNAGALAGAAAMAPFTGGMSFPVALGAAGLAAAGGDAYQQLGQRMAGNATTNDGGEAAKKMFGQALSNMLVETGIRGASKAADFALSMAPDYALSMLKMPAESVKRAIVRLKQGVNIIPDSPEAKALLERKAVDALGKVQQGLMEARNAAGQNVGVALDDLQQATKGAKIFDIGKVAQETRQFMRDSFQTTDPVILKTAERDIQKIEDLLGTMEGGAQGAPGVRPTTPGLRDAKTVNKIKQAVQSLTSFNKRGLPEIETDLGHDIMKHLGRGIRDMIDETAEAAGHTGLKQANADAHAVYNLYDDMRPMLSTVRKDPITVLGKVDRVMSHYNHGGLPQEILSEVGQKFPHVAKAMDQLLDAGAARVFTQHAPFTPSPGMGVAPFLRSLVNPSRFGKGIVAVAEPGIGKTSAKMLTRAGVIMATPISSLPAQNVKTMLAPEE